jgi:hypothetical protein
MPPYVTVVKLPEGLAAAPAPALAAGFAEADVPEAAGLALGAAEVAGLALALAAGLAAAELGAADGLAGASEAGTVAPPPQAASRRLVPMERRRRFIFCPFNHSRL